MTEQPDKDTDPLDAVAIATVAWRRAVAATEERAQRDRKIISAFDAGCTGREIAAASGLDLDVVYNIHSRADVVRSDEEIDRQMAATKRRIAEMRPDTEYGSGEPMT